ncbi:glycosyltransferase [Verrucomicrobium sp. BvORR106]|uniref:glycosyltransferase n=1 Tax=Verrucomicrobium sp. BvORR106 TaxID=1403819 RepID=UPI00056F63FE|nr:glycosyltransferase [Verrucomicrobium sp. BvORR106]
MQLLKTRLKDALTHHRGLRNAKALLQHAAGVLRRDRVQDLLAYQGAESKGIERRVNPHRHGGSLLDEQAVAPLLERYRQIYDGDPVLSRTLILKPPGPDGEKGVLYVAFEYNLYRLLRGLLDPAALLSRYDLVLSTSWSPTSYALLEWALHRVPGTLYLEAGNPAEMAKLEAYHPRIKCVSTMPCEWIHPGNFAPRPHAARTYDVLMVANWAPFKRHYELFAALAKLPASLKVVLIGQKEAGRTAQSIIATARDLGAKQELEVLESLPIQRVREIQCDSKTAVLMSRREGSCVAAMEALFANTPIGMRSDAHVGSRKYVNEHTGRLFNPRRGIHHELAALLEAAPYLEPRRWAADHLSCHQAITRLNHELKDHATGQGRRWTRDLAAMCWNPYPTYVREADAQELRPLYEGLFQEFPGVFTSNLIAPSLSPAVELRAS